MRSPAIARHARAELRQVPAMRQTACGSIRGCGSGDFVIRSTDERGLEFVIVLRLDPCEQLASLWHRDPLVMPAREVPTSEVFV